LNSVVQDVASRVDQQRRIVGQRQPDAQVWQASQNRLQTDFVVEELPDDAVATGSHRTRQHGGGVQRQPSPAEMGGSTGVTSPSKTTQRTSSSVPKQGALGSPAQDHLSAISHRPAVPSPVRAQITAPHSSKGPVSSSAGADNALVTSNAQNLVVVSTSQRPRLRALEASPVASGVSDESLARVERPVPRATMPPSKISPPRILQRMKAPSAQTQLPAPPAAARQETLQQPSRRLQRIEPPASGQRQLETPPTQSEASRGTGQELVLQGKEVARKTPSRR
jgi:hypothetical protein